MEEQLFQFVEVETAPPIQLDPAARFIHSQIVELAKLCLEKSKMNQLTGSYFDEVTTSLEKLLVEAHDKYYQVEMSIDYLSRLINKFLLIIARVARLLECIEFDPLQFSQMLDFAEQQARQEAIKADIPKYIISKLGIADRDPFDSLSTDGLDMAHASNLNSSAHLASSCSTMGDDAAMMVMMMMGGGGGSTGGSMLAIDSACSLMNSMTHSSSTSMVTPASGIINPQQMQHQPQCHIVSPTEDDFDEVKLISNGAYG
jgi:hypothetical protein